MFHWLKGLIHEAEDMARVQLSSDKNLTNSKATSQHGPDSILLTVEPQSVNHSCFSLIFKIIIIYYNEASANETCILDERCDKMSIAIEQP